jgi:hypothetical protein
MQLAFSADGLFHRRMNRLSWVGASVAMTVLAGCGGSDGGSCGMVAACGGDIVADWTIVDACLTGSGAAVFGDFCPTATLDASGLNASGMASYRADMTFDGTITMSGSMAFVLPASCLTTNGITLTCAQLDQAVKQAMMDDPDPSIQSISCAGSGSCRCTAQMAPQTSTGSGTYTTSGTTLLENGATASDYCVKGNELHLVTGSMAMGSLELSGAIVLTK